MMSSPTEIDTEAVPPQLGVENSGDSEEKPAEKSRQCPICHVYYKYGNSYWQHVRYVHASFLSQCVICEKSYKRTTMAKHHILHSHKIAWHLCSNYVRKINKSDLSKYQEKNEIRYRNNNLRYFKKKTLHLISSFNCYNCPESFTTITDLFEHVKCHRKKENYVEYNDFSEEVKEENVDENDDINDINIVKNIQGVEDGDVVDDKDNQGVDIN